jgi:anthranilate synthase component 1
MIKPSFEEFKEYAAKFSVVPVYREIIADMDTPVSVLKKLRSSRRSFLLESVEGGELLARNSFLGVDPLIIVSGKNGVAKKIFSDKIEMEEFDDPLKFLERFMSGYRSPVLPDLPGFTGGAVCFMGYDCVKYFEKIEISGEDYLDAPEFIFYMTDKLVIFDHLSNSMKILKNVYVNGNPLEQLYKEAVDEIDEVIDNLRKPTVVEPLEIIEDDIEFRSNMTEKEFAEKVEKAKEYIFNGDIFQMVLSQRFSHELRNQPLDVYRALRIINPSPYMYFLEFDDLAIVGSSPEPLVKVECDTAETRPIAGTRKRGADQEEDLKMEKELLSDKKELAEHIMLVDLGRNDLGRVCVPGSVRPKDLMIIERYSHVMHIVSSVIGKVEKDKSVFDVLRAVCPAGTVSGAPKIRAMEIINELEKSKRGPYAGVVGYFSFTGSLDSCITIRTIITKNNAAYIQAGAGIVADSIAENEYNETKNKAKALFKALNIVVG